MESYAFRGAAGEVVRGFVRPSVLITLVPVLLVTGVAGLAAAAVSELVGNGVPVLLGLGLVVSSALVGRFALAAREGDLEAGFVSGRFDAAALAGFVLRYVLLTICWVVPVIGAGMLLARRLGPGLLAGGVGALVAAGPIAVLVVLLAVVVVLAPTLCFLVATYTDSAGEVVSPASWHWLLVDRRADLVSFYVNLLGGCLLFGALVTGILAVATALSATLSLQLAATLFGLVWVAPSAGAPILLGRLCGAFVASDGGLRDPDEGMRQNVLASTGIAPGAVAALAGVPAPAGYEPPAPATGGDPGAVPSAAEAQRRIRRTAETDLAGAIADGERHLVAHPGSPGLAAEMAALYHEAGREDESRRTVVLAIERALRSGSGTFAVEILTRFAAVRAELDLGSAELQQLGWAFLQRGDLESAAWSFDAAATRGGDAKVEKGLLAVADAMAAAGDTRAALGRLEAFLAAYPGSMLASQARSTLTRLARGREPGPRAEVG